MRPDLAPEKFRFLVIHGFDCLIVYQSVGLSRPRIVRILHGARDMPALLADHSEDG